MTYIYVLSPHGERSHAADADSNYTLCGRACTGWDTNAVPLTEAEMFDSISCRLCLKSMTLHSEWEQSHADDKPCEHRNTTDYYDSGQCDTPYCEWWEIHCRDCNRFVVTCQCGFENGESGWPRSRWMRRLTCRQLNRKGAI